MKLDITMSGRSAKGQREEELLGYALKHESRVVRKPKTRVERRIANEYAPICSDHAEFGKTRFHQRPPDSATLPLGFDRNRAKSIPAGGAIADGYSRERNMPYDATGLFGDERDRKCMIRSQGADDELLSLMAVWMREKSPSRDLLNCVLV